MEMVGYTRKSDGKRVLLEKFFTEDIDYKVEKVIIRLKLFSSKKRKINKKRFCGDLRKILKRVKELKK